MTGWLYVAIIFYAIKNLDNPLTDTFAVLHFGGIQLPVTLELLVILSWALLLDAPHVWATLGRTLFDPDEWQVRGRELRRSFIWFFIGPHSYLFPILSAA